MIIGKEDQVIYHYGSPQSLNTLFEMYASMDLVEMKRDVSDKMLYNLTSDANTDSQCIFALPSSHDSTIFLICSREWGQNSKKIKWIMKQIHYEYAKAILDPFYELNSAIVDIKFRNNMERILQTNN